MECNPFVGKVVYALCMLALIGLTFFLAYLFLSNGSEASSAFSDYQKDSKTVGWILRLIVVVLDV